MSNDGLELQAQRPLQVEEKDLEPQALTPDQALSIAASAEKFSEHPLARAMLAATGAFEIVTFGAEREVPAAFHDRQYAAA